MRPDGEPWTLETFTAGAWLIPTAVIFLGVGILVATLRGTNQAED